MRVASFCFFESVKTMFPEVKVSIGPSKFDFGLFAPFAMALIFPFSLVKKERICEVSE